MSPFEFDDIDQEYTAARRNLHDALENLDNLQYATEGGPLVLSQVSRERTIDPEFQEVVAQVGWPSHFEDSMIEPVTDYHTHRDFLESMRPESSRGTHRVSSDHFFIMLRQQPISSIDQATTSENFLGIYPVLRRAHVLAPDLFRNLQASLAKITARYSIIGEEDRVYEALLEPQNEEVVEALHMAYEIMGRLLKVNDYSVLREDPVPILSADVALRAGR